MRTAFEVIAQEVMPFARAAIAKRLIEAGFSQRQVADKLGVSQPAISQYKHELRGAKKDVFTRNPKILEMIDQIAGRVVKGELNIQGASNELFMTLKDTIVLE